MNECHHCGATNWEGFFFSLFIVGWDSYYECCETCCPEVLDMLSLSKPLSCSCLLEYLTNSDSEEEGRRLIFPDLPALKAFLLSSSESHEQEIRQGIKFRLGFCPQWLPPPNPHRDIWQQRERFPVHRCLQRFLECARKLITGRDDFRLKVAWFPTGHPLSEEKKKKKKFPFISLKVPRPIHLTDSDDRLRWMISQLEQFIKDRSLNDIPYWTVIDDSTTRRELKNFCYPDTEKAGVFWCRNDDDDDDCRADSLEKLLRQASLLKSHDEIGNEKFLPTASFIAFVRKRKLEELDDLKKTKKRLRSDLRQLDKIEANLPKFNQN